ncbi:PREDICTED: uncharacterized protein LOC102030646 [Chinchilla lanigera]|uniref:uncharacterized protein LOC102030646 n=1 Tax=Chinchilla lanigera TaxID=34839 RepID=UPI00038E9CD4|nr:PREDICTED: uncharacterized protein LOC102030646 [Chinchilla lanigera]
MPLGEEASGGQIQVLLQLPRKRWISLHLPCQTQGKERQALPCIEAPQRGPQGVPSAEPGLAGVCLLGALDPASCLTGVSHLPPRRSRDAPVLPGNSDSAELQRPAREPPTAPSHSPAQASGSAAAGGHRAIRGRAGFSRRWAVRRAGRSPGLAGSGCGMLGTTPLGEGRVTLRGTLGSVGRTRNTTAAGSGGSSSMGVCREVKAHSTAGPSISGPQSGSRTQPPCQY